MENRVPPFKYDDKMAYGYRMVYDITVSQLGLVSNKDDARRRFDIVKPTYDAFLLSEYNKTNHSEYECLEDYIADAGLSRPQPQPMSLEYRRFEDFALLYSDLAKQGLEFTIDDEIFERGRRVRIILELTESELNALGYNSRDNLALVRDAVVSAVRQDNECIYSEKNRLEQIQRDRESIKELFKIGFDELLYKADNWEIRKMSSDKSVILQDGKLTAEIVRDEHRDYTVYTNNMAVKNTLLDCVKQYGKTPFVKHDFLYEDNYKYLERSDDMAKEEMVKAKALDNVQKAAKVYETCGLNFVFRDRLERDALEAAQQENNPFMFRTSCTDEFGKFHYADYSLQTDDNGKPYLTVCEQWCKSPEESQNIPLTTEELKTYAPDTLAFYHERKQGELAKNKDNIEYDV